MGLDNRIDMLVDRENRDGGNMIVDGGNMIVDGVNNDGEDVIRDGVNVTSDGTDEDRLIDAKERENVIKYLSDGCGCIKQCSSSFDECYLTKIRSDCAELTHDQLDLVVMGQVLAVIDSSSQTGGQKHTPTKRFRNSCQFRHKNNKVFDNYNNLK